MKSLSLLKAEGERGEVPSEAGDMEDYLARLGGEEAGGYDEDEGELGEDWDREGNKLYEWTQELNYNDDVMQTPQAV